MGAVVGRTPLGRSWAIAALGILSVSLRLLRRATAKKERIVFSERMAPGERLVITNSVPARRHRR